MEIDKKLVKRQWFIDLAIVMLIGVIAGFLIGEYKNCTKNSYSFDYGCRK